MVLAEAQTAGRGREQRAWHSQPRGNLYFSLVARSSDMLSLLRLNTAACVATAEACRALGVDAALKWPNDVWWRERRLKLAGMLVDSRAGAGAFSAIVGIGLNVNQRFLGAEAGAAGGELEAELQNVAARWGGCIWCIIVISVTLLLFCGT